MQVSVQDAFGKTAVDLCTQGGDVYNVLYEHHTTLEQRAQKMAAELLEEEQSAKTAEVRAKSGKNKKKKGRKDKEKASAVPPEDEDCGNSPEVRPLPVCPLHASCPAYVSAVTTACLTGWTKQCCWCRNTAGREALLQGRRRRRSRRRLRLCLHRALAVTQAQVHGTQWRRKVAAALCCAVRKMQGGHQVARAVRQRGGRARRR